MHPPPVPAPCNMAKMTYADELSYAVVAKICQDVGWHTAHKGTLTMLAELMRNYMRNLSSIAVDFANHSGRNQPNVDDLAMTFKYMNIDLVQLQDYVVNVDSSSFPQKVPIFPVPCRTNRAIDNCAPSDEDRPEFYEEWMPSLVHNKSLVELDQSFEQNKASKDEIDADKGQHPKTNGTDHPNDAVDSEALATPVPESDSQKNKLVIRFSLSKSVDDSTEENRANADDEEANEANLSASALIAKSLKRSRAFQHFINSSLYKNPDNPETKNTLRVADTQRLPNTHESRENSPEPEPSIYHNGASNEALNHSTLNDNKKARRLKKKKNKVSDFDDPAFDYFDDGLNLTQKLKVKDFGLKKERTSKNGDSAEKKSKKKFLPFSIKMPGIGMADDNAANMFDFAEPSPFDLGGEFMPKTKRQYKKKEKPPKVPSERGRGRPKKIKEPLPLKTSGFDLEDGELPPSPSSLSPTKLSKKKGSAEGFSFGENEAAKTLVLMSESNETSLTGDQDRKRKFDDVESTGDDSMADPNTTKTTPKKLGRPLKRPKGSATKKFVKSAEIIESSGDSSDDDANIDSNPVSLLPPLPEPVLMSTSELLNVTEGSNLSSARKRHNSNSSISSISSLESAISSSSLTFKLKVHSKSSSKKQKSRESKTEKDYLHKKESKMEGKKESKPKKIKDSPHSLVFKPSSEGEKPHKKEKLHKKEKKEKRDESMLKFSNSSSKQKYRETEKDMFDKREFKGETKKESKPKKIKDPLILVLKTSADGEKQHKKEKHDESLLKFEVTKPSSKKQKFREPKTEKDLLHKKESKGEGKKESKSKKVKDAPISLILKTPSDVEKHHKKEKSKDESKSSKKYQVHADVSCSVITETIKVDETVEEELYFCPACSLPDTGTPMIGCDNCDDWFHYACVGIITTPADDAKWFCTKCTPKVKGEKPEAVSKKVKKRDSAIDNSVTITPIPPMKSNISAQFGNTSAMTFSSPAQHQPSITITATSTPGYIPTGRPRGRPRKDSYQAKPQVTITAVPPPQFQQPPFQPSFAPTHHVQPAEKSTTNRFSYPSADLMMMNLGPSTSYDYNTVPSKPSSSQKRSKKEICPTCNDTTKDRMDLIRCESCSQWYHWGCVGIKSPPSPDSNWYCRPCKGQKSTKHSTLPGYMGHSSIPLAPTGSVRRQPETPSDSDSDNDSSAKQRCGTCFLASATNEDVSNWVACDECDQWYHFACQNVTHAPDPDESWFCKKCIARQKSIANRLAKVRRFNPQS